MANGFEDAYAMLGEAQGKIEKYRCVHTQEERDSYARSAFYDIYRAARHANMCFGASAFGGYDAEGGVFSWAESELAQFSDLCFRQYHVDGSYPHDNVEQVASAWLARARAYADKLSMEASKQRQNIISAQDRLDDRDKTFGKQYRDGNDFLSAM